MKPDSLQELQDNVLTVMKIMPQSQNLMGPIKQFCLCKISFPVFIFKDQIVTFSENIFSEDSPL